MATLINQQMQPPNTPDSQTVNYDAPLLMSSYSRDTGLLLLPVAGPDGIAPRVIKTHAVIGKRMVQFQTSKIGTPPTMPAMEDTPSHDTFMGAVLNFPLPLIAPDQNAFSYSVSGSYEYVQYGPLMLNDGSNGRVQTSLDDNPVYGPRGNGSQYQTGKYPFIPILINALSYLNESPVDPSNPVYDGPLPDYFDDQYVPPPIGANASSAINLTDPTRIYFDTTYNPNNFIPGTLIL